MKSFKDYIAQKEDSDDTNSAIAVISTDVVDRDKEVLLPSGAKLEGFLKNPIVLWAHEYRDTPIGSCQKYWIKKGRKSIKAKWEWANTEKAQEIRQLWDGGFLRGVSVGFLPAENGYHEPSPDEVKKRPEFAEARKIYDDWELLEFSIVPVPANPEALVAAVKSKSINISPDTLKELGFEQGDEEITYIPADADSEEVKGVIPYKETPKADEGAAWDAAAEVRKAEISDLKIMCAWFDSANPDVKGSYKLPHHKADGSHAVVWRAVAAAMAALLGARGGIDMPSGDRKGVYNHLVRHYKQFDKEPPDFKEIKDITGDIIGDEYIKAIVKVDESGNVIAWENIILKPLDDEHSCRINPPEKYKKFARKNCEQKHDGKCIDVIYGIIAPKKSEIQSLRFKTNVWTESAARTVCKERDGAFEPAKKQINLKELVNLKKPVKLSVPIDKDELTEIAMKKIRGKMY